MFSCSSHLSRSILSNVRRRRAVHRRALQLCDRTRSLALTQQCNKLNLNAARRIAGTTASLTTCAAMSLATSVAIQPILKTATVRSSPYSNTSTRFGLASQFSGLHLESTIPSYCRAATLSLHSVHTSAKSSNINIDRAATEKQQAAQQRTVVEDEFIEEAPASDSASTPKPNSPASPSEFRRSRRRRSHEQHQRRQKRRMARSWRMLSVLAGLGVTAMLIGFTNVKGFLLNVATESHTFTDLFGATAFILATAITMIFRRTYDKRQLLLGGLVILWALRLVGYLTYRIMKEGHNDRFTFFPANEKLWEDNTDPEAMAFPVGLGSFWLMQSVWAWTALIPVTIALYTKKRMPLTRLSGVFAAGALAGIGIEAVADFQQYAFMQNKDNKDKWPNTGLWASARHPNYFGEMIFWWSLFGVSLPLMGRYVPLAAASPLLVTFLLLNSTGIPHIEKKNQEKYGKDPEYVKYVRDTNLLIPWLSKPGVHSEIQHK
jgi:steroid 5-alpha reductase family enzyme